MMTMANGIHSSEYGLGSSLQNKSTIGQAECQAPAACLLADLDFCFAVP